MAYTTINKSTDYFNTKLYTGTASSLALTGVGHQPDMVWQKVRSTTSSHRITDVVRGTGQVIYPNDTAGQSAENAVTAFGTDGFTVGTGNSNAYNANGATYVGWSWKANGAGSANTDGDITSTVSANTTSGFSIIKFTGNSSTSQSFGHGLSGTPKMWFIKNITDGGDNWQVYFNNTDRLKLDTTEVMEQNYLMTANATTITTPSNSGGAWGNENGKDFIVYAWEEKTGFSKFGTYTGNGETSGVFIYTGFKPAFVIIKRTDSTNNWKIIDNKRSPFNVVDKTLNADSNGAEGTETNSDFLSNGFKLRRNGNDVNGSGASYIFMAFAEAPLVGSNNVPCTAR